MYAIGIDIGTTGICGVLIDAEKGGAVRVEVSPNHFQVPSKNCWERVQDAGRILERARQILDQLICDGVEVIGVTGQMHGICYVDCHGRLLSGLYTWQDRRGELIYKEGQSYCGYLGVPAGYGHATHFYNRENGLVPDGFRYYATIYDCFVMDICGNKKPIPHTSSAASFGLPHIGRSCFSGESGAEATGEGAIVGSYRGIPVAVALGDNQASYLGSVKERAGMLVNVGTGSQISMELEEIIPAAPGIEVRPYIEGRYLLVGAALCGGRAYAMLKDFFMEVIRGADPGYGGDIYALMDRWISEFDGMAPSFRNTFCGSRDGRAEGGSISGIQEDNFTPGGFGEGILSGIAGELWELYSRMGRERKALACAGNGVRRNRHLQRRIAECFLMKPRLTVYAEEAAYGAAMFALTCWGSYRDSREVSRLVQYQEEA